MDTVQPPLAGSSSHASRLNHGAEMLSMAGSSPQKTTAFTPYFTSQSSEMP